VDENLTLLLCNRLEEDEMKKIAMEKKKEKMEERLARFGECFHDNKYTVSNNENSWH